MATIPPTTPRPRCTADCKGKRCNGSHPRSLPAESRRGLAAMMRTTEARVQTR